MRCRARQCRPRRAGRPGDHARPAGHDGALRAAQPATGQAGGTAPCPGAARGWPRRRCGPTEGQRRRTRPAAAPPATRGGARASRAASSQLAEEEPPAHGSSSRGLPLDDARNSSVLRSSCEREQEQPRAERVDGAQRDAAPSPARATRSSDGAAPAVEPGARRRAARGRGSRAGTSRGC